ncbi:MAG: hypothetical protein JO345_40275 [Streptosporangiaceae bacterium]|nr:hypothetical protein [Streptosporangiaceae bacterium]
MTEPGKELAGISREAAETATELAEAPRPRERRKRVVELAKRLATSGASAAGRGSRAAQRAARMGAGWLAGQVLEMAPRLKVRNQAELRAQFPGKSPEEIADALIDGAARASGAAGAAAGVWAVLPLVTTFPAEVAAETLVVVGIEVKLVAELHEAYGVPAEGSSAERMRAYVAAWAHRRGVSTIPGGVVFAAGSPLAQLLRRRLAARAGRSTFSLAPLLTGAAAGAMINGRETRKLGRQIRQDLRRNALSGPVPPGSGFA